MEVTLYDGTGRPVAYVADDGGRSIYLWTGQAVAYIDDRAQLYGWNGRHLGWYADGVIYDLQGWRVGSTKERCPHAVHAQPAKHAKHAKYAKHAKHAAYAPTAFRNGYSTQSFEDLLKEGAAGGV